MDQTDSQTIQAVLDGDVERYAALVDKYQAQTIRLALSLLGNEDDARDVSQEAFISAYQSLGRFRGHAAFSTWLYRIVVNKCKDLWKYRARRPVVVARVGESDGDDDTDPTLFTVDVDDPTANPSDYVATRELSRQLSHAIGQLPMKQRTAFCLHHLQGFTLEEVATVMRCRIGTVKSHIFRAIGHLRTCLRPWLSQEVCE